MITDENFSSSPGTAFIYFIYMSFGGLALKLFVQFLIPDMPEKFKTILKRHGVIINRWFEEEPVETKDENEREPELTMLGVFGDERIEQRTLDNDQSSP